MRKSFGHQRKIYIASETVAAENLPFA